VSTVSRTRCSTRLSHSLTVKRQRTLPLCSNQAHKGTIASCRQAPCRNARSAIVAIRQLRCFRYNDLLPLPVTMLACIAALLYTLLERIDQLLVLVDD